MKKISENERITLTVLAEASNITQGALSNYISGKRKIPYDLALTLELISGIYKDVWLRASWGKETSDGDDARFILRRQLGLYGLESERKLAMDVLRSNYNNYYDCRKNVLKVHIKKED